MRNSVDLPQPEGPSSTPTWPGASCRETSSRAVRAWRVPARKVLPTRLSVSPF